VYLPSYLISALIHGFKKSFDFLLILYIPALFTGLAFWVVKCMHDITLVPNRERLSVFPYDSDGLEKLIKWFQRKFLISHQLFLSLVFSLSATISLHVLLASFPKIRNDMGFIFAAFCGLFAIGNGVYSAIVIPTLSNTLSKHRLNLYPFDPSNTETLQEITNAFGKLALATGVFSTALIIIIFLLRPLQTNIALASFWLFVGWGTSIYSFVFPVQNLAKAVRKEKKVQLDSIESSILNLHKRIDTLSKEELERLDMLIKMRKTLYSANNNPLNISAVRDFIVSLLLPFASFMVGIYGAIDW
jgi:hypothetical protein